MRRHVILPAALTVLVSTTCVARVRAQDAPASLPPAVPAALPAMPAPVPAAEQRPAAPLPGPIAPAQVPAMPPYIPYGIPDEDKVPSHDGSVYIPVDSWVYPAMTRLYSLGYAGTMSLSMRPYTRQSLAHILEETRDDVVQGDSDEAREILAKVADFVRAEPTDGLTKRGFVYGTESVYVRAMGIQGQTLRDSYHLGQTIVNDYGRPYQEGFNGLLGFSTIAERGRFSLYVRGEYQHAPGGDGYSFQLASALSQGATRLNPGDQIDYTGYNLHQSTIPQGPIGAANPFRLQEASISFHLLGTR